MGNGPGSTHWCDPSRSNRSDCGAIDCSSDPGTYTMQWQLLQESVEWFGGQTEALSIQVLPPEIGGEEGGGNDPVGSCAGFCGGQSNGGCYCDDGCSNFGDCCADVCDVCVNLAFCGGNGEAAENDGGPEEEPEDRAAEEGGDEQNEDDPGAQEEGEEVPLDGGGDESPSESPDEDASLNPGEDETASEEAEDDGLAGVAMTPAWRSVAPRRGTKVLRTRVRARMGKGFPLRMRRVRQGALRPLLSPQAGTTFPAEVNRELPFPIHRLHRGDAPLPGKPPMPFLSSSSAFWLF